MSENQEEKKIQKKEKKRQKIEKKTSGNREKTYLKLIGKKSR